MELVLTGLSIGCNAVTQVVSWSDTGVLAFGANRAVAIYDPSSSFGIETTLRGHTLKVTVVQWLDSRTIVSGSSDSTLRVWQKQESAWNCIQVIKDHVKSISCLAACNGAFVSGSMDGSFILHKMSDSGQAVRQNVMSYKPYLPLALAITRLPGTESFIVAVGGTTTTISLYAALSSDEQAKDMELKAKLPGHEDWIRSFSFIEDGESLLLASASQDRYIRLWRIDRRRTILPKSSITEDVETLVLLENKSHDFNEPTGRWKASFEALLVAHEDWVFSVDFSRDAAGTPILLSSSADSSIVVWHPDQESQIWMVQAQLGVISTKGASTATGSTGGFWGALFSPLTSKERLICAWNKTGSIRIWRLEDGTEQSWKSVGGIGGHVKEVRSLSWSPNGEYFLSTSLDQSTRLWAKHINETWKEFARPQIHGYDIQSVHVITPTLFVSGAEEKIVRIFQATSSVVDMLARVAQIDFRQESTAEAANVPALGLSNKALTSANQGTHLDRSDLEEQLEKDHVPISKAMLDALVTPPSEDHLQRHTLFPEVEKLYGHGYEIQALSASHDGHFIVSGCRATTPEHAVLRLYDAHKFKELAVLEGHTLTVTKARFNLDDSYLLSVSRDRSICIYSRKEDQSGYTLLTKLPKAHKRIIWDCTWFNVNTFATASRDCTVSIWTIRNGSLHKRSSLDIGVAVTSCTWAAQPAKPSQKAILALGLEDGMIKAFEAVYEEDGPVILHELARIQNCDAAITGLEFSTAAAGEALELAFCSEDSSVGILQMSA